MPFVIFFKFESFFSCLMEFLKNIHNSCDMFCHIRLFFADKRSGILAYCYINCTGAVFGDVALFVAVVAFDLLIGGLLGQSLAICPSFLQL